MSALIAFLGSEACQNLILAAVPVILTVYGAVKAATARNATKQEIALDAVRAAIQAIYERQVQAQKAADTQPFSPAGKLSPGEQAEARDAAKIEAQEIGAKNGVDVAKQLGVTNLDAIISDMVHEIKK